MSIVAAIAIGLTQNNCAIADDQNSHLIDCTYPNFFYRSSAVPTATHVQKTAIDLYKKGYYQDSLPWFEKSTIRNSEPWYTSKIVTEQERSLTPDFTKQTAKAYEKVGEIDKALEFLKYGQSARTALPHVRLLLTLGRCAEAEKLCEIRLNQLAQGNWSSFKNEKEALELLLQKSREGQPYSSEDPKDSPVLSFKPSEDGKRRGIARLSTLLAKPWADGELMSNELYRLRLQNYRGQLYLELGQLKEAMADAKAASASGDISLMDTEAELLLKLGHYSKSIAYIKKLNTSDLKQRDKNYWSLYLAKAYLGNKEYENAIEQASEVVKQEKDIDYHQDSKMYRAMHVLDRMTAQGYLIKALAEFELGRNKQAKEDALSAENEFLEISLVDCRDHVRRWRVEHLER